jgi:hypothetical protein
LKRPPADIWKVRVSELSEAAYAWTIEGNTLAEDELRRFYKRLQYDPRALGQRFRPDEPDIEHWLYESPRFPRRPRLRIYYTIDEPNRVASIERLQLL